MSQRLGESRLAIAARTRERRRDRQRIALKIEQFLLERAELERSPGKVGRRPGTASFGIG
jgi:hypothetical protein